MMNSNTRLLFAVIMIGASIASVGASAQVSDGVIKIGILNGQSGIYASVTGAGSVAAAKMAVHDFGGKAAGRPVKIVSADHQNKTDVGTAIARKWLSVDGVDAIFDIGNSAISLAVQNLARENDRVVVHISSASADLTGKACSPNGIAWMYDTYSMSRGLVKAAVKEGNDTWFIITSDYAFGHSLEKSISDFVLESGGKVVGTVRHPPNTSDFASFILQAQSSKAKMVAFATGSGDVGNLTKAAQEFGLVISDQKISVPNMDIHDVDGMGLSVAQGLQVVTSFYWDATDKTRAFTERFRKEFKANDTPSAAHAGTYGAVMHFLKAVDAAGTVTGTKVAAKMREIPVEDFYTRPTKIRADGRVMREQYLVEVKSPSESKYPWDYFKVLRTIAPSDLYIPEEQSGCLLSK
jgi:branched-chain amino acid transport system substrate-binding protein